MNKTIILHNPRCSKSRETLALLQSKDIPIDVIEYLKAPLDRDQLSSIKGKLGVASFIDMMRTKEPEFKQAELSKTDSDEDALLVALVTYPKLLERPIVITESHAKIGRPPEAVLSLFE